MTNYNRITHYSPNELANFLSKLIPDCEQCPLKQSCSSDTCAQALGDWLLEEATLEENESYWKQNGFYYYCTKCDSSAPTGDSYSPKQYPFCPQCGRKMVNYKQI